MIRKLQIKFVAILMSVVTIILLAIFLTMILSSKNLNAQLNSTILHQALSGNPHTIGIRRPSLESPSVFVRPPDVVNSPSSITLRRPVLVFDVDENGNISNEINQLHFVDSSDVDTIAKSIAGEPSLEGTLSKYDLHYLKQPSENGFRIAVIDVSTEQELIRKQIVNSLIIGTGALTIFLLISIFLSRLAINPVKIAWQNQKQFISDASHELKTPLTVILSNIDMLQKDAPADEQNALRMEHINVEATRMKQLVEDMLTLAKSDGSTPQATERVDFSYLIKNTGLVYEPIIFDEHKTLTLNIEDGLFVEGNAPRLQQLAYILLDNARKYSSEAGAIQMHLKKQDGRTLQLMVSNTGEPIPEDELKSIFSRFYRRDQARSEHGSFGLGLSIAQSIVTEHSGKIWAERNANRGNSFYATLPLA